MKPELRPSIYTGFWTPPCVALRAAGRLGFAIVVEPEVLSHACVCGMRDTREQSGGVGEESAAVANDTHLGCGRQLRHAGFVDGQRSGDSPGVTSCRICLGQRPCSGGRPVEVPGGVKLPGRSLLNWLV